MPEQRKGGLIRQVRIGDKLLVGETEIEFLGVSRRGKVAVRTVGSDEVIHIPAAAIGVVPDPPSRDTDG